MDLFALAILAGIGMILIPAIIILPFRRWRLTIPIGALACIITAFVYSESANFADPGEGGEYFTFGEVAHQFVFGPSWLICITYAFALYAIRCSFTIRRKKTVTSQDVGAINGTDLN